MKSNLSAPPDAMGALYFLPGQYLFKRNENGREITKALSSEQIARAFRDYETDTGWLTTRRILHYRKEPEDNYFLSYEPAGKRTILVENEFREVIEIILPLPTLILRLQTNYQEGVARKMAKRLGGSLVTECVGKTIKIRVKF